MEIHSLYSTLQSVLHEHVGMGYFVDLLLKSLFVLILMVLVNGFSRRLAASMRHLVWTTGFISLFILPLFIGFLPKIQVPIAADATALSENVVTQGIVTFADNINTLTLDAWWEAFLDVYFALLFVQVCYILLGLCKVCCLSRQAVPLYNPKIRKELDNLILDEGLTVSVGLKTSREVFSPVSWGLFSPEIILPERAENWDREKIRNVLIHELSHIQRLDWLTGLMVRITRAVYWFNPLIWYAARKLDEEAEQACDDAVILVGRCQNEYASNLLEIASHARLGYKCCTLVQAIAGSHLGSRIFSILDTGRKRQKTEVVWVVRGLMIGFLAIAILASLCLVPLVNVSSIDPNASTAFTVIFIPEAEASAYLGAGDTKHPDGGFKQPAGKIQSTDSKAVEEKSTVPVEGAIAAAKKDSKSTDVSGISKKEPSVLEEYISATGYKDSKEVFEMFVKDYTQEIIRNVESEIDLSDFGAVDIEEPKAMLVAIKKYRPDYPMQARRRGIEGYSIVQYEVDSDGNVRDPVIVDSNPGAIFDRSSLRAIQKYEFEPPMINGEVVSMKGLQTKFIYQLKPG